VSVAAVAWPDSAAASRIGLSMALGAVAPTPVRAAGVEALVRAEGLAVDRAALSAALAETARPIDDVRATAAYRLTLLEVLAAKALDDLAGMLQEKGR